MIDLANRSELYRRAEEEELARFLRRLTREEWVEFNRDFENTAHTGQTPPDGDWFCWLIMAGRGYGKTRAGAEWVISQAEADGQARIALIGASLAEARAVMVEGESGILACTAPERRPIYEPSLRRVRFTNGAEALLYSAAEPESLRGPQHSHAWCDEVGKWPAANRAALRCWDNLMFGLRLGHDPRIIATTTPRTVPLMRRLMDGRADGSVAITTGATQDNRRNLPARYIAAVEAEYGGTTLGRQELEGLLLDDVEGALWTRSLIEQCRTQPGEPDDPATRVVVGVDPPAGERGDACGIVVCALCNSGKARVLADCSVEKPTPEGWARAVATAASEWQAERVVAEANQGGQMVASVLRAADVALPLKLVHASKGKSARAEPVAALYESGKVKHAGLFPQLEDELCGMMTAGGYEGPGRSPDRADALVWALSELMLGREKVPRVVGF